MALRFSTKRKLLNGSLLEKADKLFYELLEKEEAEKKIRSEGSNKKKDNTAKAFKWIGKKPDIQLEHLHKGLVEKKFISSDTNPNSIKAAFSGYNDIIPLNIKWIAVGKNKAVSKSALLHLIDLLVNNSFIGIEEISSASVLYKKLQNTFVDRHGEPLKNFKQSNSQRVKKPVEDEMLKEIISSIPK